MKNNENWQQVGKNDKKRKEKRRGFAHCTPFHLLKKVRKKNQLYKRVRKNNSSCYFRLPSNVGSSRFLCKSNLRSYLLLTLV